MDSAQVYSAELDTLLLEGERLASAVMVTHVSGQELGTPLPGISRSASTSSSRSEIDESFANR